MKYLLIDSAVSADKYVIQKATKFLKHKERIKAIGYSVSGM